MAKVHFQHEWFFVLFLFCGSLVVANVFHFVIFRLLKKQDAAGPQLGWGLQKHLGRPARAVFVLTCALIALPLVPGLTEGMEKEIAHVGEMLMVLALGWFATGLVYVAQVLLLRKYDLSATDNYQARRVHTQFQVFRRIAIAFVVVLTAGRAAVDVRRSTDMALRERVAGVGWGGDVDCGDGGEVDGLELFGGLADRADRTDTHRRRGGGAGRVGKD